MNDTASEHFSTFARLGYAARGIVYLVVGGLAVLAALGEGGDTTGSKGALRKIMEQPFGDVLMIVIIIGLFGYAAWRFVQSVKDTDNHGTSAKGLAVRSGLMISSLTHTLLAVWAISLLTGDDSDQSQGWTAKLMAMDSGELILGMAGITVIGAGLAHIYKGWTARFDRYIDFPNQHSDWMRPICRFGLIARGVVWCIIGWFLIHSALQARSGDISGMDQALDALRDAAYGPWLLGIVAAGLFAFGLYSLIEAIYRRVNVSFSED